MPVVQFHLEDGSLDDEQAADLLRTASRLYADVLGSPVERVRAFVVPHRPQWCAVGGEVLSEGGSGLAYFTAIVLTGRPADQHERLLAGFTDLLVRVAGVPREKVRGRIEQVRPEDWGIGGAPAAQVRAGEIAARAG
ncbi:tautomerase family protein [Amycolatopsis thermoflava]|uniref:tautomerase family protein n=1 Tax=Amycolatopsis thermoflava TaxID=84480 RepID=UPI003F4A0DB2